MKQKTQVIEVSADEFKVPDGPVAKCTEFHAAAGNPNNRHRVDDTPVPTLKVFKPLPDKLKVCIYRFPYGGYEHACVGAWIPNALFTLHTHPRVGACGIESINATPTDMARNRAVRHALDNNVDFMIMVDNDMFPDYQMGDPNRDKSAMPFLPHALDFAIEHGPCCVGAPYCSQPPQEDVLVSRWRHQEGNDPDGQVKLSKFTREEAIERTGFEEVAALATGLLLIDTRPLALMQGPWFSYQYSDSERTKMISTEDIVFTRDLSMLSIPQYVFWNAWAGHWKLKLVTKPTNLPYNCVPARFAHAYELMKQRQAEAAAKAQAPHGTGNPRQSENVSGDHGLDRG